VAEVDPSATNALVVKKKVESLREVFERNEVKAFERSGAGTDDIYKPCL
jgi:hypothetical protein